MIGLPRVIAVLVAAWCGAGVAWPIPFAPVLRPAAPGAGPAGTAASPAQSVGPSVLQPVEGDFVIENFRFTHTLAAVWKTHLVELLQATAR